jgi:hypothetical protein
MFRVARATDVFIADGMHDRAFTSSTFPPCRPLPVVFPIQKKKKKKKKKWAYRSNARAFKQSW